MQQQFAREIVHEVRVQAEDDAGRGRDIHRGKHPPDMVRIYVFAVGETPEETPASGVRKLIAIRHPTFKEIKHAMKRALDAPEYESTGTRYIIEPGTKRRKRRRR